MNRRSFLKTIFVASASLAIAPTDFLTPHSQLPEIRQWTKCLIEWEKYEKIGPDEWVFVGKAYMKMEKIPRMAFGIIKEE